ncbi:MAG: hypothetical protein JNJ39_08720 [Blastocatellia bacterium]|jgi:hypothetical protein|nr:hypothetical protein [Blastocatellia bacterium]
MNDASSTLIVHCGARKVTREELKEIPVPEGTRTHQPLSHYDIVEVLEEALSFRYMNVIRDEYAVSPDGMKLFGVMDLNTGFDGGNFSIGLRNSNDKSMRLALTAGLRVTVCDNMAFSGDFTPLLHKHTRKLELKDVISIAVDRIQRGFDPLERQIGAMRDYGLTDNDARLFIYTAFMEKAIKGIPRNLMSVVHDHYFDPGYEEFKPRNLWSLSNAFTSAFKQLAPMKQFEVTAKLGTFLNGFQNKAGGSPSGTVLLLGETDGGSNPENAPESQMIVQRNGFGHLNPDHVPLGQNGGGSEAISHDTNRFGNGGAGSGGREADPDSHQTGKADPDSPDTAKEVYDTKVMAA